MICSLISHLVTLGRRLSHERDGDLGIRVFPDVELCHGGGLRQWAEDEVERLRDNFRRENVPTVGTFLQRDALHLDVLILVTRNEAEHLEGSRDHLHAGDHQPSVIPMKVFSQSVPIKLASLQAAQPSIFFDRISGSVAHHQGT